MSDETSRAGRRAFLTQTGTALAATTGLTGCSGMPFSGSDDPEPPVYDEAAVNDIASEPIPDPPSILPIEIPQERFDAHRRRTRELLDAVPEDPVIPNEGVVEELDHQRTHVVDDLGESGDEPTPLDRLDAARYDRSRAAEVWGAYTVAVGDYEPAAFDARYDTLRGAYHDFAGAWNYRGTDPVDALLVHYTIEDLVERGRHDALTTGPFPADPQAAVFEAAEMIAEHEHAVAALEDAQTIRDVYLEGETNPPSNRLRFVQAARTLANDPVTRLRSDHYENARREGRGGMDADLGYGPRGTAFDHARRYVHSSEDDVRGIHNRTDPAQAVFDVARYRAAVTTFKTVVDAIYDDRLGWPEDVDALRDLRATAVDRLETAWQTEPRPLAVGLASQATGLLYYDLQREDPPIDDRDLARYVGTLHYVRHFAGTIPDVTAAVVDALTSE